MILVSRSTRLKPALLCLCSLGAIALAGSGPVHAQSAAPSQEASYDFDVPAQKLARSLSAIAERANMQVVYPDKEPLAIDAPAVHGRMTASQALATALAGSGYSYRYLRPGVITLLPSTEGNVDGERVTSAVKVQGTQGSPYFGGAGVAAGVNGTNGSHDITATEGTGSFTSGALTIGSKVPQALKDVPQSISLVASAQLAQQNITSFDDALKQLPGISFISDGSAGGYSFLSRGFYVNQIQIDGGAPLRQSSNGNAVFFAKLDMSQYDHIELLRGAMGTFNGYGSPGGTINLSRKKPLDHEQFGLEAQAGSWSHYRVVADATAPVALDGHLRGRLVLTYEDNKHFYEIAEDHKYLIYGIAELDVTDSTLLSAGISFARDHSLPFEAGRPRYNDGRELNLPRSLCLCFKWSRVDIKTTELFGSVEQKLFGDWTAKLNVTHNSQFRRSKVGQSEGGVSIDNNTGPMLGGGYMDLGGTQFTAETTVTGSFEIFGQRQEITLGSNYANTNGDDQVYYASLLSGSRVRPYIPYPGGPAFYYGSPNGDRPPINVLNFNPDDPNYAEPPTPLKNQHYIYNGEINFGAYLSARLTAFDKLHLTTAVRFSWFKHNDLREGFCTYIPAPGEYDYAGCATKKIGDVSEILDSRYTQSRLSWPPAVSLSYDLTKDITAYVGYTDIYREPGDQLNGDRKPVDPVTGSNVEAGVKWAARDGRLNLSLGAYRIREKGFSRFDEDAYVRNPDGTIFYDPNNNYAPYVLDNAGVRIANGYLGFGHYCCFIKDPTHTTLSQGIDFEVAGEIRPGWQVSGSLTYTENENRGEYFGDQKGKPFITIQPKYLFKFWTGYNFGAAGHGGLLSGLTISGGVNGQSSAFYQGSVCTKPYVELFPGYKTCPDDGYQDYAYTVAGYAIFSALIDYKLSSKWSVAVNLENLLDKSYLEGVGGSPSGGDFYGTPRSVAITLRGKW